MKKFTGELNLRDIEFEVEDDATDDQVEDAFNNAVDDRIGQGLDSMFEYEYEEVSS